MNARSRLDRLARMAARSRERVILFSRDADSAETGMTHAEADAEADRLHALGVPVLLIRLVYDEPADAL